MQIKRLTTHFKTFREDTEGAVALEFVLMMPILFWSFMAVFTFFDGYRQSAVNLKAAYTIGDILSRETNTIDDTYMDSMHALHRTLTRSGSSSSIRVTVIRWDEEDNRYYRDWSAARGGSIPLTEDNVRDLANKLPVMPDGERVILVETNNTWEPMFRVGLADTDLDNFIFTRPRFAPQLCWEQC